MASLMVRGEIDTVTGEAIRTVLIREIEMLSDDSDDL